MGEKTVLLVDDSLSTAKQLKQIISGFPGYEIVGRAKNGAEAVKLYGELKPDIVCMDIVMPIMDGLQALRMILKMNTEAKVVMVSSLGGVGDRVVEALKMGARNVIAKPFEDEKIREMLDAL